MSTRRLQRGRDAMFAATVATGLAAYNNLAGLGSTGMHGGIRPSTSPPPAPC